MRYTEFKPLVLLEFNGSNVSDFTVQNALAQLDAIADTAPTLPPEAGIAVERIIAQFNKTQAKVDAFIEKVEASGKIEPEPEDFDDESGDYADIGDEPEVEEPVEVEPTAPVEPPAEVPAEEVPTEEVPAEEVPTEEVPPEQQISETNQLPATGTEVAGDSAYDGLIEVVNRTKEEILKVESSRMSRKDKDRAISGYQQTINACTAMLSKYVDTVNALKSTKEQLEASEKFVTDINDLLEDLGNKVQGYASMSPDEYKAAPAKVKKVHDNAMAFTTTFRQALSSMIFDMLKKNKTVNRMEITKFLEACKKGEVLDMIALTSTDIGNIRDHVRVEFEPMINLFQEQRVFSWSPGKTSGAVGPGEMALSMMGSPTSKAREKGDIDVGGTMYEIKAGLTSGGRLNSEDISKGPEAMEVWTKGIEDIVKTSDTIPANITFPRYDAKGNLKNVNRKNYTAKTYGKTGKEGAVYNFNDTYLNKLNDEVLVYSDPETTYNLFYNTITKLINNTDAIKKPARDENGKVIPGFPGVNPEKLIWDACYDDGTVDVTKMLAAYTRLAYESYNRSKAKVESILFLNTTSLDYTIVRNGTDFMNKLGAGDVKITSGFNFNDSQQTATPAYLAPNRSKK